MGEGFEEIEAITVYDVVKRIGKKAQFVSIGDDVTVRGSNGAELRCDKCISDFTLDDVDALVLPGGLPGASNLGKSTEVKAIIGEAVQNKLYVAAICAAPLFVIDKMEEFHGKNVCLYPDLAGELENTNYKEADVLVDGRLITGKGPSKAMKFALSILENVYGKAVAEEAAEDLLFEDRL